MNNIAKRDELAAHLEDTAHLHLTMGYTASKAFKEGWDAREAFNPEGWQPIETAPKDRPIEAWFSLKEEFVSRVGNCGKPAKPRAIKAEWGFPWHRAHQECWLTTPFMSPKLEATHWRPLPSGPNP